MQKRTKILHKNFCLQSCPHITYYIYVTFQALRISVCLAKIALFKFSFFAAPSAAADKLSGIKDSAWGGKTESEPQNRAKSKPKIKCGE